MVSKRGLISLANNLSDDFVDNLTHIFKPEYFN